MESQRVGAPSAFIAQVTAILCAETQRPTLPRQTTNEIKFRKEDQMEVLAVIAVV
jgi:hypothetical protein